MSRVLGVAAAQVSPVALDPEATWDKFEGEVRAIAARHPAIDLIAFPEMYLAAIPPPGKPVPTGYRQAIAQPVPGALTARVTALARDVGRWLVPGSVVEIDEGRTYNTALVASPDGRLVSKYRKVSTWLPYETCARGSDFVTFAIPEVGCIGLMICYDGWFPEIPRALAWLGAEVIIQPTSTLTSDRDHEVVLARANAMVNQVFLISPNTAGAFGPGRSVIVDPEGRILSEAGAGEEFLIQMIDLDAVAMTREFGTAGLNQLWKQLRDEPPPPFLPHANGYSSGEVMRALGPFRHPVNQEQRSHIRALEAKE
jgi:predicted amidohydrolase